MSITIEEIRAGIPWEPLSGDPSAPAGLAPLLRGHFPAPGFCVHHDNSLMRERFATREAWEELFAWLATVFPASGHYQPGILPDSGKEAITKLFQAVPGLDLIAVPGAGVFSLAGEIGAADRRLAWFLDLLRIYQFRREGRAVDPVDLGRQLVAEYGEAFAATAEPAAPLAGKVAIITGGARGFGRGIAEFLLKWGACVVLADLNAELARQTAQQLSAAFGEGRTLALAVDVAVPEAVRRMADETVVRYGGIDILLSNAGILRAGSLAELDLASFELATRVNYTAFFLCTREVSRVMKLQAAADPAYTADIIQINSKSGLAGSKRNFAYAGSKFGGIGLTQSFALELVEHRIKVNAVCPGNFFEGPLWSDPEKGLFVQYLQAGKVPGAETVGDVRRFYEDKVPMRRGCRVADVARAVLYLIEQQYETGQALPVTGGQVMLK